jgi:hypothetical protein
MTLILVLKNMQKIRKNITNGKIGLVSKPSGTQTLMNMLFDGGKPFEDLLLLLGRIVLDGTRSPKPPAA